MLIRLLNFICGYRLVSCNSSAVRASLNLFMQNELDYWKPRLRDDGSFCFFVLNREWNRFSGCIGEYSGLFKTERLFGLPNILSLYKKRIGVPIGLLTSVLFIYLSTLYTWDITVSGNEYISDEEIISAVASLGFGVGSRISEVDFEELCHEFILQSDEISWVSINMVGTTAEVRVREKEKKSLPRENGSPSNLVAKSDGIIIRTETECGDTVVKGGQPVKKGELLISGVVQTDREDESKFILVRSKARVYAETYRTFTVRQPLKGSEDVYVGRKNLKKTINFFGNNIKLKENSSISESECDIIKDNIRIVLFEDSSLFSGIPLPIWISSEYTEIYDKIPYEISEDEAYLRASRELSKLFQRELGEAEVLTRAEHISFEDTDGARVLCLTWQVKCIEDITEEVPIGIM